MSTMYQIQTTNETEMRATIGALWALGYRCNLNKSSTLEETIEKLKPYPVVVAFTAPVKEIGGNVRPNDYHGPVVSLIEFLKETTKTIKVKLNEEYSAVITPKGITVGCQTFPLSVVQELSQAVAKVLS